MLNSFKGKMRATMTEAEKNKVGNRFSVIAYVTPETYQKIELQRGDVKRSTFLGKLISRTLQLN